jgi:hypothetical protein
MATYGHTFTSGDTLTPPKLNDARTVTDIVDADISSSAGIAATKLAFSDSVANTQIKSVAAIAGTKSRQILGLKTARHQGRRRWALRSTPPSNATLADLCPRGQRNGP